MANVRAKAKKKAARKAVKPRARRTAKAAPKRARRAAKPSLAQEFGALAEKITTLASGVARAGLSAIEQGSEKIGHEIAAIKRAALSRTKH